MRFVFLIGILGGLGLTACGDETRLSGTELQKQPATDFMLTDHRGDRVSLSDLRGQAVALTFIFTNCPDVCPLIASKMRVAHESLPEDLRDDVAFVAITVDPERDTPDVLHAFSTGHQLADNPQWFALTGERTVLEDVWRDYGIEPGDFLHDAEQHGDAEHSSGGSNSTAPTPVMLAHTDAIYFIDPDGRERALLRSDATPETIANNLRTLAN